MLKHVTLDQLVELKLHGMAHAFEEQLQMPEIRSLSFEERLGLLVEREATERASRRLTARLRRAKLREQAAIEDVDWRARRGKAGVGKTFLAWALAHKA
jgi:DNA replication protein DnaC